MRERLLNQLGQRLRGEPPRPKDWLAQGGDFTTSQLCELAMGLPGREGGQKYLLVTETGEFRFIPQEMHRSAQDLAERGNTEESLRYLLAGYRFWMSCNEDNFLLMPLVANDGACEWLQPKEFSWGNVGDVIFLGEYGQRNQGADVVIETREGSQIVRKEINPSQGAPVVRESTSQIVPRLHERSKSVPFKVGKLADVRFSEPRGFRQIFRKFFARYFEDYLERLRSGEMQESQVHEYLNQLLENLGGEPYPLPLSRYIRVGERPRFEPHLHLSHTPIF